jgi:hypothetical protein
MGLTYSLEASYATPAYPKLRTFKPKLSPPLHHSRVPGVYHEFHFERTKAEKATSGAACPGRTSSNKK